jgi:hypothetical protein
MNKNTESWLPPGVYARWCKLFPGVSAQPSEFYDLLQKALEQRKIPKIEISRVYHREGGIFSAKREYLRMSSERLVFDVCAAPFGTGFFISYWFAELPLINPLLILLGFAAFGVLSVIFAHVFGFWLGASLLALGVAFLGWYMRVGIGNFLADIDLKPPQASLDRIGLPHLFPPDHLLPHRCHADVLRCRQWDDHAGHR